MEGYKIGDICFTCKETSFLLNCNGNINQFYVNDNSDKKNIEQVIYKTIYTNLRKHAKGVLLQKTGLYELYDTAKGKFIIYHWATCRFAFGYYMDDLEKENCIQVFVDFDLLMQLPMSMERFFSCAGLHSKLLQKDALVFHSSYINWNNNAVLFAGHSGVGKSTQASLWEKYAGAEIINGDRALLRKKEGKWHSYGYPCCGSSAICINRTLPLLAVVLLEQGEENRIEMLSMSQKIRIFLSGSEMYLWSTKEFDRVYEIAKALCQEILIIKLVCRQEQEAVTLLKNILEGYSNGENIGLFIS